MSYMAMHNRIRKVRGSAMLQICSCGEPAKEWAYNNESPYERVDELGRRYFIRMEDYNPMCFRCHRLEDKSLITHCPKGHPYEGDNVLIDAGKRKCRECVYERNRKRRIEHPATEEQKARKAELQRIRTKAKRAA